MHSNTVKYNCLLHIESNFNHAKCIYFMVLVAVVLFSFFFISLNRFLKTQNKTREAANREKRHVTRFNTVRHANLHLHRYHILNALLYYISFIFFIFILLLNSLQLSQVYSGYCIQVASNWFKLSRTHTYKTSFKMIIILIILFR